MKKNLLIATFFFATTLTFATNVENDNFAIKNYTVEEKTSKNNVSEDETIGCAWTTITYFYRTYTKKVLSMDVTQVVTEVVTEISSTCTTCYQMGPSGVTSTTTCN